MSNILLNKSQTEELSIKLDAVEKLYQEVLVSAQEVVGLHDETIAELLNMKLDAVANLYKEAQESFQEVMATVDAREEEVRQEIEEAINTDKACIEGFLQVLATLPMQMNLDFLANCEDLEISHIYFLTKVDQNGVLNIKDSQFTSQVVNELNQKIVDSGFNISKTSESKYLLEKNLTVDSSGESHQLEGQIQQNISLEAQNLLEVDETINLKLETNGSIYTLNMSKSELKSKILHRSLTGYMARIFDVLLLNLGTPLTGLEVAELLGLPKPSYSFIYFKRLMDYIVPDNLSLVTSEGKRPRKMSIKLSENFLNSIFNTDQSFEVQESQGEIIKIDKGVDDELVFTDAFWKEYREEVESITKAKINRRKMNSRKGKTREVIKK